MNKSNWFLVITILGIIIVILMVDHATQEDWVSKPYWPGRKYQAVEVNRLDNGAWWISHKVSEKSNVIRSCVIESCDLLVRETSGNSWLKIGEKDPTELVYNPKIMGTKTSKDFRLFINIQKTWGNLIGFGILGMGLLAGFWLTKKQKA